MFDFRVINKILENYTIHLNNGMIGLIVEDLNLHLELQERAETIKNADLTLKKKHQAERDEWKVEQKHLQDDCPHLSFSYSAVPCTLCGAKSYD